MFQRKPKPEELQHASFDELLELKIKIDDLLRSRQGEEIYSLRNKINAASSALGISLAELFGLAKIPEAAPKERKRREVKQKYRNPDNPEETWSGRGRPPQWMQTKIDENPALTKEHFAAHTATNGS